MAAVEAQCCGLPVVGYNIPGLSEAVCHPDLLVPLRDDGTAADAVERLLADRAALSQRGDQAARWAEQFDVGLVVPQYLALYSPALAVAS